MTRRHYPDRMDPRQVALRLYTQASDHEPLDWSWVDAELAAAGTYWVVARTDGYPHPRPVWGVWLEQALHLSIGTPANRRALVTDPRITVHLESGTDVVVVEGIAAVGRSEPTPAAVLAAYDAKYDWRYDQETYGVLTRVDPTAVLAWRTKGPAGRDSFQQTGRWTFSP